MSRRRRAGRFWAWYGGALVVVVGTLQAAQARQAALPASPATVAPSLGAVMAVPPKPQGASAARGPGEGARYTHEGCARMPPALAEGCFVALAWQRASADPEGALAACEEVTDAERRMECTADVAELHTPMNRGAARALCSRIPAQRWRDQCVFGVAMALGPIDAAAAVATCEDAGMWTRFCRHDVNGARSAVDLEAGLAYCGALDPPERPTCVHGVGKYVARVDPTLALSACARVPLAGDLRGQCIHGVGWAAAEREGPVAAQRCGALGEMHDACMLGVAYHTKRTDPAAAEALCRRAVVPGERQRCVEMVGREVRVGAAAPVR